MSDKYPECPLQAAGFHLEQFQILPTMVIGPDGKCICTVSERCMNVDKHDGMRCTLAELKKLDSEAVSRRAWQMGGDW